MSAPPSRAAAGLLAALAWAGPAAAQDRRPVDPAMPNRPSTAVPRSLGETFGPGMDLQVKQQVDRIGSREGRAAYGLLGTEALLHAWYLLPHGFGLYGVARLEPAPRGLPAPPARDLSLFLGEAHLAWARGWLDLFAGKIHPRFGAAWDDAPGLYGSDLAEEYELRDKLGAGVRAWLSDALGLSAYGRHSLKAEVFRADRGALSTGLFARRWAGGELAGEQAGDPSITGQAPTGARLRWANRLDLGGADNAHGFAGRAASLHGEGVPLPGGVLADYVLGWSERDPGSDLSRTERGARERGVVAGLYLTVPAPVLGVTVQPMVEWARRRAEGGDRERDAAWLTTGARLRRAPWLASYAYAVNRETMAGAPALRDLHSAGLTLDVGTATRLAAFDGLGLTVGWRRLREAGTPGGTGDDLGAALTWGYRF